MSLLGQILGTVSGGKEAKISEQLLFDKVIGFRGVIDGVGASTLVFNTACALSDITRMNICVVDTHIMYPVLAAYFGGKAEEGNKDWFNFDGTNMSDIAYTTRFQNVYLVSLYHRGLPEMLSNYDCEKVVISLFDELAKFFDVILVDLSHEPTFLSGVSAVRCNKIYTVFEPSLGCMSNLKSSINALIELGIPPYKLSKVILNKEISDVNSGYQTILNKYNFSLLAKIPFSVDIARNNVIGKKIWGMASNKSAITQFNIAMDNILDDILSTNEQVKGYIKNEDERTETENINERPKRVDGEAFEYTEPEGKPFKSKKSRPNNIPPRGEGVNVSNQVKQDDSFTPVQSQQVNNSFTPVQTSSQDFIPVQTGDTSTQVVQDDSFAPVNSEDFTPVQSSNVVFTAFDEQKNSNAFVPITGTDFSQSPFEPIGGNKNA